MKRRACLLGYGAYLPERVVPNTYFEEFLDTDDAWIQERTGIKERRFAAPDETTSMMAVKAARTALYKAGLQANDLDMIVCATTTPDLTFPATAAIIQAELGMTRGAAFDIQAVCSGFVYGLMTVNSLITSGQANRVLLIGAETFSRILDFKDRGTCILFGDGAGAMVFEAQNHPGDQSDKGIFSTHVYSDGRLRDLLYVDGGPGSSQTVGYLRMEGRKVFQHAVTNMTRAIKQSLTTNGFTSGDVDKFIPHQANQRIIAAVSKSMKAPADKVVSTVAIHANTSAASIPLAFTYAASEGQINPGDLVCFCAMGGGFTWGSALLRV